MPLTAPPPAAVSVVESSLDFDRPLAPISGLEAFRSELEEIAGQGAIVYKLGGSVTGADATNVRDAEQIAVWRQFARELIFLLEINNGQDPIVVVHGGGKAIDAELERHGVKPQKIDGRRVTDEATMAVVEKVLSGQINRALVDVINDVAGYEAAVGIAGSTVLSAKKTERNGGVYGLVGEVESVDVDALLAHKGKIVVVSPTARNNDFQGLREGKYGTPLLNINGDDAAESVVRAIHDANGVQTFIAATDVPGVKGAENRVLSQISKSEAGELIEKGVIVNGMIPKIEAAQGLLEYGIRHVRFVKGTEPEAIVLGVLEEYAPGTRIVL